MIIVVRFGNDKRIKDVSSHTPGVGSYDTEKKINQNAPKYSFSKYVPRSTLIVNNATIDISEVASLPGPGRYSSNPNNLKKKAPSYSISGKSTYRNNNTNPGPGQYDTTKGIVPKGMGSVSKAKRNFAFTSNGTLNKSSMGGNQTPGPGRYNSTQNSTFINSKGFKIGSDKRKLTDVNNNNPGPGNYITSKNSDTFSNPNKKGFGIGKAAKKGLYDSKTDIVDTPGPGRYNSNKTEFSGQKGFKFGLTSHNVSTTINTPGPGQYDLSTMDIEKSRAYGGKFSKSKREEVLKDLVNPSTPGPGRYSSTNDNLSSLKGGKSVVIGKDKRMKNENSITPGPGQYRIPCSIRDMNKYAGVGGKFDDTFDYV